eukprot:TRINITY_DN2840_c4_g1_i1.p1 TRINITY_DN2840_c4_g1~~TRINITY_DN2840_c4_g1_i1.p1  ORF type:complete len:304 (+),score=36.21 TRINITY_DN2840_c4_g1_i1:78-914(+)
MAAYIAPVLAAGPVMVRESSDRARMRIYRREVENRSWQRCDGRAYAVEMRLPERDRGDQSRGPSRGAVRSSCSSSSRGVAASPALPLAPSPHPASASQAGRPPADRSVGTHRGNQLSPDGRAIPLPLRLAGGASDHSREASMEARRRWVAAVRGRLGATCAVDLDADRPEALARVCAKWLGVDCRTARGRFMSLNDFRDACRYLGLVGGLPASRPDGHRDSAEATDAVASAASTDAVDDAARLWADLSIDGKLPVSRLLDLLLLLPAEAPSPVRTSAG